LDREDLPRFRARVDCRRGLARELIQATAASELVAAVTVPVTGGAVGKRRRMSHLLVSAAGRRRCRRKTIPHK
jgi:hypothetical protein